MSLKKSKRKLKNTCRQMKTNIPIQTLWDEANGVLRRKLKVIQAYLRTRKISNIELPYDPAIPLLVI